MADKNEDPKTVYADIIGLPHHQSADRNHMSLYDRAAQFAPFAALVGYDEMVKEEARLTGSQIELSDTDLDILNRKLGIIIDAVSKKQHPEITFTYFMPDATKEGGEYTEMTGFVRKIDTVEGVIHLGDEDGHADGRVLYFSRVSDLQGEIVDRIDEAWLLE